ncbi:nucleotidyltransferase family protein [Pelotomaculum propionicicum]|uniref:Molybdenum cofactor cytidylyltransferase n=1 Tax=Pelotomaculum propionicicum TaxID=258475 RepID=A0A4Y7RUH2_9FIRM|nr:nucleotidyltransferase family protein [Pelotomaculum propionicicum]NLI12752.1 nucleotidyltransferase family protein [Peptococcaceae bacterium]TEB12420.1 Molybdenum cofactor cytidylyltransferase [Pelotomaculum propionicicum]
MISAIILAAGMSVRMGSPKQLLKLGDKPLIRIVTENVLASSVDEILVVTGYKENQVSAVIKDLPVKTVINPCYEQGQGTSLAAGVKNLPVDTEAFLVFMVDQPFITSLLINKVIEEFKKRRCLALRPVCNGQPGHPVIFSYDLSAQLQQLAGDEGARPVLKKLGSRVEYFTVQDQAAIFDIDTPEIYESLKSLNKLTLN